MILSGASWAFPDQSRDHSGSAQHTGRFLDLIRSDPEISDKIPVLEPNSIEVDPSCVTTIMKRTDEGNGLRRDPEGPASPTRLNMRHLVPNSGALLQKHESPGGLVPRPRGQASARQPHCGQGSDQGGARRIHP